MSSYLPDSITSSDEALTGCWSAGERCLLLRGELVWVNVWFHFFDGGEAIVSMRCRDQPPSRVHGRWWTEREELIVCFGGGEMRAAYRIEGELLHWTGEILLRLPDQTASLPFGIQLPYRPAVVEPAQA